ncbi:MAG: glycosyltransferase [Candidatus Sumerlaeaceae bacterium]|nr:glycosyltransferase [Candidatus Sumerlaeaceae bacterium]
MERPLRVFYLVNAFEPDAPTRLMAAVAAGVQVSKRCVCRVAALRRTGPFERHLACLGLETRFVDMPSGRHVFALQRLAYEIRTFQPDVFHASLLRPTLLGVPIARLTGVPRVVVTQHGTHEWEEGGVIARWIVPSAFRRVSRHANAVVAVSDATRHDLLAAGLSHDRLRVIPNGVDTVTFHPEKRAGRADLIRSLGFPDDTLLVGAAGNLRAVKGHIVLVRAAVHVVKRLARARFVVWGEGPLRECLEQAVTEAGLGGCFVFPGWRADMASAMAACDVFVQPSLRESFGLAAAEAMSAGVAVAASNTGGLPELVSDGEAGLLFSTGSPEALAVILHYLLSDAQLRARLGAAARRRVLEFFSQERMVRDYLSLYEHLVATDSLQ